MNRDAIIKNFDRFLDKHNIKKEFYHNMARHNNRTKETFFEEILKHSYDGSRLVDAAFGWSSSPEGHTFWADLHRQWQRFANKEE